MSFRKTWKMHKNSKIRNLKNKTISLISAKKLSKIKITQLILIQILLMN